MCSKLKPISSRTKCQFLLITSDAAREERIALIMYGIHQGFLNLTREVPQERERTSHELLRAFPSFQNLDSDAESELHVNVMKRTLHNNHPRVIEEIKGAEMEGKMESLKEVLLS